MNIVYATTWPSDVIIPSLFSGEVSTHEAICSGIQGRIGIELTADNRLSTY